MNAKFAICWFSPYRLGAGLGFLLLFMPTLVLAQFNYTINPDLTATITGYSGPGGTVVIPATIAGLPVVAIGSGAMQYTPVTSVWVTNSVRTVADSAFAACSGLTNAVLGNSVTSVGSNAFNYCANLNQVTIGSGITNIGINTFYACSGLLSIDVDANNNAYSSPDGLLFDKPKSTLIQYPAGRTGSYVIPDSVINIADNCFYQCKLTNITIPDSTKTIGASAFSGSSNLATVTIGNGVTNIPPSAFQYSAGLSRVSLGNSLVVIGKSAFDHCSQLAFCTLPNSLISIEPGAFNVCGLVTMTIPDSVRSLGNYAFANCGSLTNVVIGSGVTNLQSYVFGNCPFLQSITVPTNVSSLGDHAFFQCYSLSNLTIENGVTNIGQFAFYQCNLTSIVIPDSVTTIQTEAFGYCTSLTNAIIGRGVSSIDGLMFDQCGGLVGLYFLGNAPLPPTPFYRPTHLIVYYVPGTSGWGTTWSGFLVLPIAMQIQIPDASFGVRSNQFGFNISGSYGMTVAVEAATNLLHPVWTPLQTNTLAIAPTYFSDPQWTNYPNRFYRVRWP